MTLAGCVSVADVADFPSSSGAIDFDGIAKQSSDSRDSWARTWKSDYEYFLSIEPISENRLIESIKKALEAAGYEVSATSAGAIIGERSLRWNEWNSVTAVYYRMTGSDVQVYMRNKITQDFTGGWRENRAKQVADRLCAMVICKPRG
jgi:hypothetical protein